MGATAGVKRATAGTSSKQVIVKLLKVDVEESYEDSTFDISSDPEWIMVPNDSSAIFDIVAGSNFNGLSLESQVPAITSFEDSQATENLSFINGRTVANLFGHQVGEATLNLNLSQQPLAENILGVSVKERIFVNVKVYRIIEGDFGDGRGDIIPAYIPNIQNLTSYLNQTTWGHQANVLFTIEDGGTHRVDYDLPTLQPALPPDGMLALIIEDVQNPGQYLLSDEVRQITQTVGDDAEINIYYIQSLKEENGATVGYLIFIQDSLYDSVENVTAHEVGHALGVPNHAEDGSDHTVEDLMYKWGTGNNPANVTRDNWNIANP